jgi:hypothetical protein
LVLSHCFSRTKENLDQLFLNKDKNRGFTRLNIKKKKKKNNPIDRLNIYFGRLCHHQEMRSIKLLRVGREGREWDVGDGT